MEGQVCSVGGKQPCRDVALFGVSLALLALQFVNQNATVQLLINMKILAELLERVTGTNKIQPDTDASMAGAKEDKNYQNEV